jgi:hypothetical protein
MKLSVQKEKSSKSSQKFQKNSLKDEELKMLKGGLDGGGTGSVQVPPNPY